MHCQQVSVLNLTTPDARIVARSNAYTGNRSLCFGKNLLLTPIQKNF